MLQIDIMRTGSKLAQVMACCQMATNHYLNQCRLISNGFCGFYMRAISHEILVSVYKMSLIMTCFNTLRPRQNGRHFPDDIFKWIFLYENVWISINISLNFVPRGPINNIPTLVQVLAWRRPGDKPLSEPIMLDYWCIYVSLGLNELKFLPHHPGDN